MGIKGRPFGVQILLSKLSKMKSFSIFFLLLVSLAFTAAEAQLTKQRSSSTSNDPSTSRNFAAILKAEMAIRSIPSSGRACLDRFSMAANGTVRPTISSSINGQRQCSFFIDAPANKLIQMTCSVIRLNSSGAGLAIYGGAEINVNPPVVNRIYTSRSNSMFLFSRVDKTDWFDCKWKMIPEPQTTEYQLCRDGTSATPNGTIQLSADDPSTDLRMCMFVITVPSDHRIQLMCSNVTLSSPDHYLQFQTVSETVIADPPAMNRVYTSTSEIIYLFSQFSNQDSFKCQWTTVMIPPLTTDNKLCRNKIAKSASGSIQPLMLASDTNVQPKTCSFIIEVPPNQLTEISCPVINFTSPGSYLHFSEISDLNMALTPLTNRVYTSGVDLIYLKSQIDVNKDWFNCTWSAIPAPSTTDFKLCRHGGTTSSSGTLQPFLDGLTTGEPRECYFFIELPSNEEIEFSCSSLNLTSPGSYLRVVGVSDFYENPPVENGIYLSNGTRVLVYSQFNNGDWFDCIWASTTCPVPVTTDAAISSASTTAVTTPATTSSTTTSAQSTTSTTRPSTTSSTTTLPTTSTAPSTTTSTTPQTTTISTTTTAEPTTTTTMPSTTSTTTSAPTTSTTTSTTPQTTTISTTTTAEPTTTTTMPSTASTTTSAPTTSTTTSTTPKTTVASTTTTAQPTTSTTRPSTTSTTTSAPTTSTTTSTTPQTTTTVSTTTTALPTTSTTMPSTTTTRPTTTTVAPVTCSSVALGTGNEPTCSTCTILSPTSGTIQSFRYPNDYTVSLPTNCLITITAPPGKKIRLAFYAFVLEDKLDTMSVYDGPTSAGVFLAAALTGYIVPFPYTTVRSNQMNLNFMANTNNVNVPVAHRPARWQATFTVV